jgi:hypothetical protein
MSGTAERRHGQKGEPGRGERTQNKPGRLPQALEPFFPERKRLARPFFVIPHARSFYGLSPQTMIA